MQTVFAEKTEDRSLDDNRHIGELFFIRMYWEKGRIPSGNILYWKDAKREDAQINFTGFDGLLLYLDPLYGTAELIGALLVFFWYRHLSYEKFGGITGDLAGFFLQNCELFMAVCVIGLRIVLR